MSQGMTRRELNRVLLGALSLVGCRAGGGASVRRIAAARPQRRGPRKLLHLNLAGGSDVLYSVDPKQASEVKPGIRPVFAPGEMIVRGNVRLAPQWAAMEPFLSRMQVINGIQCSTVAHLTGSLQTRQLRRDLVSPTGETAVAVMARAIDPDAAVHCIQLGKGDGAYPTEGRCMADDQTGSVLTELHKIAGDDRLRDAALAELDSSARTAKRDGDPFRAIAHVIRAMHGTKLPSFEAMPSFDVHAAALPSWMSRDMFIGYTLRQAFQLEWAIFALAHDLTSSVYMESVYVWDSHVENGMQDFQNKYIALLLSRMVERLARTPGADGRPQLDDFGILVTSGELGRFPYANAQRGKDHFPQISAVLLGPGLRAGGFGETGDELVGGEVSLATGRPGRGGTLVTLDDLGRTLLEWVGVPAPDLGYGGRVLEFCLA